MKVSADDLGLLGRCAWEREQGELDLRVLAWVARFRFVTAKAVSERFGMSWQRANARLRRLEARGLVASWRPHVSEPKSVYVTSKGGELLGIGRRRTPRLELQRGHEQAIVWLATRLELSDHPFEVLTERECRREERRAGPHVTLDRRYSVELAAGSRNDRKRWPDLVLRHDNGERTAVEIEFSPKTSQRLDRILTGYAYGQYRRAVFLVADRALAVRIQSLACDADAGRSIDVHPWPALPAGERAAVAAALEPQSLFAEVDDDPLAWLLARTHARPHAFQPEGLAPSPGARPRPRPRRSH